MKNRLQQDVKKPGNTQQNSSEQFKAFSLEELFDFYKSSAMLLEVNFIT